MRKLKLPGRDVSRPRLDRNDVALIQELGMKEIKQQARDIVEEKLEEPPGSSVPAAGNPVYKAMHACNASSREQLEMSHRIPADKELNEADVRAVVDMLVRWVAREYNFFLEEKGRKQRNLGEFSGSVSRA